MMNEESGNQNPVEKSSSPAAQSNSDAKEAKNESDSRVEEQPVIKNEVEEAEEEEEEPVSENVADKAAEPMDSDEAKYPSESIQKDEPMEVDATPSVRLTSEEPVPSSSNTIDDPLVSRLAEVVKTDSEPPANVNSGEVTSESESTGAKTSTLSTENLISVLEGSNDKELVDAAKGAVQASESQPQIAAVEGEPQMQISTPTSQPVPESKPQQSISDLPPPKMNRKYIYKLKSKTGKVLRYVSSVPIVLKRPVISLTKMEEEEEDDDDDETRIEASGKTVKTEADDADSDNSTKENNVKANDASMGVTGPRLARKRGRPPLSQKAPVITIDDNSPEAVADGNESFKSVAGSSGSTPSYGVQTRKRQLKFLPDGRVVTPTGKKYKSAAAAAAAAVAEAASSSKVAQDENRSSDTDVLTESDEGSQSDRKTKKLSEATKKFTSLERKISEKKGSSKKVFDYESYFREKSATSTETKDAKKKVSETPKSMPAKTLNLVRNSASTPSVSKVVTTPTNNSSASTSTPASANKNAVDPAQLLSSLIGVPIFPHQLNIVKFKPKVIQDRKTMSTQKNVTFVDETTSKKSATVSQPMQQQRSTSFRVSSKPSLQKILPKPLSSSDRASTLIRKTMETTRTTASAAARLAVTTSKLNAALTSSMSYGASNYRYSASGDASKFDSFSDTKVVKTKEGPKKCLKSKDEPANNEVKTVYDLVQNVFEQIPSWNLHIIPDTNSFCIAQVSRGRMGIPILKKSIELNAEFGAKVYVHQLHCKKYDGVYDTENKILSLIREIDALAA